jgi:acyl dehydratase
MSVEAASDKALLAEGRITPEGIAKMRELLYVELRRPFILNTEFNVDAVRRFCWGLGNDNPLFMDPEYSRLSPHGQHIAPNGLLYTTHPSYVQVGLPGVHGLQAGTNWRFFAPVPVGTKPHVSCWLDRVEEREGRFGGASVWAYFKTVYSTDDGRVLAEATSYTIRSERKKSRERGKLAKREMKVWSLDEMEELEDRIVSRERRGANPRWWDDVHEGEDTGEFLKGPLCSTDMISWYMGSQPVFAPAHEWALKHYRRHPKWAFRNPDIGVLEPNIRVHENMDAARSSGLPGPYDVGIQRQQWAFQMLEDWAGDNSFIKKTGGQFRAMNYFGDLTDIRGKVARKYVDEDGDHVVDIDYAATNQLGEVSMPGTATIVLPSRDKPVAIPDAAMRTVDRKDYMARVVPDLKPLPGSVHA